MNEVQTHSSLEKHLLRASANYGERLQEGVETEPGWGDRDILSQSLLRISFTSLVSQVVLCQFE